MLTGYLPAVADYDGDGVADIASMAINTVGTQHVFGRNSLLMQLSKTGTYTGTELGLSATDTPTPADFDGDGKSDPAVYGFLDPAAYEAYYSTTTTPFASGTGRFAYIPSSGTYPTPTAGAANGTKELSIAKVVVVNIGGAGDLPAVADYDGDGKADFAVYEPSKAQFLYYDSSTFNPNTDPTQPGNAPSVLALGKVGDVPASADYQGVGHAQFAVYDAASGTFLVRPNGGGATISVSLGGPGDIPVSADYEGLGHADYAVYDPSKGDFLVRPSDGSATRTVVIGAIGDTPTPAKFGDGKVDFATYTPSTQQFQYIQFPSGIKTKSLGDPDAIPVKRTDDYATGLHTQYDARTTSPPVMFLGDSITYYWPANGADSWQGREGQFGAANNGVAYDTTQNLLWRVENGELAVHPKVVVLNIGTNDFTDRTVPQVAHTLRVIMDQIHAQSPGTTILLMGVFPRGSASTTQSAALQSFYATDTAEIRDLDEHYIPLLATPFASRNTSNYPTGDYSLNIQAGLSTNGADPNNYYANPSEFVDLLHPNLVGYQVWASAIDTPLRLMLHREAIPGDYDGDGKTDLGVYGSSVGGFAVQLSSSATNIYVPFGTAGAGQSLVASGDYDGDGKTDFAVYQPALGGFSIRVSSTNTTVFVPYGPKGAGQAIPAPGDYDGDGKTDIAIYGPGVGGFAIHNSATNTDSYYPFGIAGAGQSLPAPGDYDGDGKTDLAVYEPTQGAFVYRPSSGGADVTVPFGLPGAGMSIPVPGDYDGNGKTDLAVYLPSVGALIYRNSVTGVDVTKYFGASGVGRSIPAPGDYDGDGKTDLAVFDPVTRGFAINDSASGVNKFIPYGIAGAGQSIPTTSSYDVTASVALGAAKPAGSVVAASSIGTAQPAGTTTLAPTAMATRTPTTRVAQATPTGPLTGWKGWNTTDGTADSTLG